MPSSTVTLPSRNRPTGQSQIRPMRINAPISISAAVPSVAMARKASAGDKECIVASQFREAPRPKDKFACVRNVSVSDARGGSALGCRHRIGNRCWRSAEILLFQPRSVAARLSRPFLRQVEQCATRDSLQFTRRRSSTACTLDHSFGNIFHISALRGDRHLVARGKSVQALRPCWLGYDRGIRS